MLKKRIKYTVICLVVILLAYNSVYFKKLSAVRAAAPKEFNADAYSRNYFSNKLLPSVSTLTDADTLINQLKSNAAPTFDKYGHALDIGNIRYFMVKGSGTVISIDENDVTLLTSGKQNIKVAIEYIFGNALRDAPGIIKVNDFSNTMDLNNIAADVDKIVRTETIPPFKAKVKKGDKVGFAGAFELNKEHVNLDNMEVIPFYLKINN